MGQNIVCFGDSNTYGYDPRSPLGERYASEVRWTALLDRFPSWDIENQGQNGREIPTRPAELERFSALLARRPHLLVVILGTNDLLRHPGFSAEDVAGRMERLLARPFPCRCLLVAPPPVRFGAWAAEERLIAESARLGGAYAMLARRLGIDFADAAAWDIPLAFDGVHFTPEGHRRFAREMARLLESLL